MTVMHSAYSASIQPIKPMMPREMPLKRLKKDDLGVAHASRGSARKLKFKKLSFVMNSWKMCGQLMCIVRLKLLTICMFSTTRRSGTREYAATRLMPAVIASLAHW